MSALVEALQDPDTQRQYIALPNSARAAFEWRAKWLMQAHDHQIVPSGDWWTIWLMLAGRGAGKTRTAAEQIANWAWENPNTRWLVAAPTSADVRSTCFEGDSGLVSVIPQALIKDYNKTTHELILVNGSLIKGIPASEPERFRGPQFHGAWCCIAGTMIATPDGDKPIESIQAGDFVSTRHGVRIVLASGISGNPNDLVSIDCGDTSLTVTVDHPILVGDQWIAAGDIKAGDKLWLAASDAVQSPRLAPIELNQLAVLNVERLPNDVTYNLTVEGEHEFIANGIVVHNCDELAAWDYLQEAWDMMMFGVRLGKKTRIICTTTPKPRDLIIELVGREGDDVVITRASTHANLANLAPSFQKQILQYEGTRLGRQEIYAELIDAEESGIVKRDMFRLWPANKPFPKFEYIIQSYDCAYTEKTYNDPTASTTWGMFKPLDGPMAVMLIDSWQDHLQYPDLRPKVIEEFKVSFGADPEAEGRGNFTSGKKVDLILIEDKAAGISLVQDLRRAHLPVMPYNPGRADKIQRLSIVANIISTKRVWIPESSQRRGYVRDWAEGFVSQICSFPDATHDDYVDSCVDSSTQVTMSDLSTKRVDEIVAGDYVMTPEGKQLVSAVHSNGIKELWEVRAGDKVLLATEDHKVFTHRGFVRVDSLIQGIDSVYFHTEGTSWDSQAKVTLRLKRLYSMVVGITATLKAQIKRVAFGVGRTWKLEPQERSSVQLNANQQKQTIAVVSQVRNTHTMQPVYDLTVENEHCYYANGILVHNCTQALRYLRDAGWLDIDPERQYDDDDYADAKPKRVNPYAI